MSELRKLAEAALSLNEPWWDLGDARVSTSFCDQDAAYIAAANPATVIGLMDEIDRLRNEAVAADIRIANDALVIAGLTAERDAAQADAKRLEWLSQQGVSFGFQDIYEGNKWKIGGPYATLRIAIDAEMKGEQP